MGTTGRTLVGACALVFALQAGAQEAAPATGQSDWWQQVRGAEPPPTAGPPPDAGAPPDAEAPPAGPAAVQVAAGGLAGFDCVEVRQFEAPTGLIGSKEDARASMVPVARLQDIQRRVAGHIPEKARGFRSTLVQDGWPPCPEPGRALVLGGRIADYKPGSQALRYWVGFGAGAQKFAVEAWLMRKTDGAEVARAEVVDRKVGGWIGGQDDKGLDDFAEKVAGFVRDALRGR